MWIVIGNYPWPVSPVYQPNETGMRDTIGLAGWCNLGLGIGDSVATTPLV